MEQRKITVAFTPLGSMDEVLSQEFQKGEISGIYQTAFLLPVTINAFETEIAERKAKQNQEDA